MHENLLVLGHILCACRHFEYILYLHTYTHTVYILYMLTYALPGTWGGSCCHGCKKWHYVVLWKAAMSYVLWKKSAVCMLCIVMNLLTLTLDANFLTCKHWSLFILFPHLKYFYSPMQHNIEARWQNNDNSNILGPNAPLNSICSVLHIEMNWLMGLIAFLR